MFVRGSDIYAYIRAYAQSRGAQDAADRFLRDLGRVVFLAQMREDGGLHSRSRKTAERARALIV